MNSIIKYSLLCRPSYNFDVNRALPADFVRLDQDILSPLAGKKELYTYQTLDFWEQIKTPGYIQILYVILPFVILEFLTNHCSILCRMSLRCSGLYLSQFRRTSPHLLASGDGKRTATIVGDVYIHPSAKVHPTSKVMPVSSTNFGQIVIDHVHFVVVE